MESVRWAFNFRAWKPVKGEIAHALSIIQKEEKDRILRFVFQKDAKASLAGRLLIRKFVSKYMGIPWAEITLGRNQKGKPLLISVIGKAQEIDFNVSHQGAYSVLAADKSHNVGVDVMEIETPSTKNVPEFFRLMTRQFTSNEWSYIKGFDKEALQLKAFYRTWCLKEAYVKSLGVGITFDLQSISFTTKEELSVGKTIISTTVHLNGNIQQNQIFEETLIDQNHIVAVVHSAHNLPEYEIPEFKFITFKDLVQESNPLFPCEDLEAEQFVSKDEKPLWKVT